MISNVPKRHERRQTSMPRMDGIWKGIWKEHFPYISNDAFTLQEAYHERDLLAYWVKWSRLSRDREKKLIIDIFTLPKVRKKSMNIYIGGKSRIDTEKRDCFESQDIWKIFIGTPSIIKQKIRKKSENSIPPSVNISLRCVGLLWKQNHWRNVQKSKVSEVASFRDTKERRR